MPVLVVSISWVKNHVSRYKNGVIKLVEKYYVYKNEKLRLFFTRNQALRA
jgi:hypothetical protein